MIKWNGNSRWEIFENMVIWSTEIAENVLPFATGNFCIFKLEFLVECN